jgi:hypothetical protein
MSAPEGWTNPITRQPGELQTGVAPARLWPSRPDLASARVEFQRSLLRTGSPRYTPIQVTIDGVIIDGHHAVRAAAEEGLTIEVLISALPVKGRSETILDLPLR